MSKIIDGDAVLDRYYAEYEKQDICDGSQDRDWLMRCLEEAPTVNQTSIPLTLEILRLPQLCQMKGERVQVARMGTMWQSEGATVFDNGDCKSDSGGLCYHELYGSTWIAFRLSPEEVQKHAETDRCE